MRISGTREQRLDPRFRSRAKARVVSAGHTHDATLKDVSVGGAALSGPVNLDNDLFVQLHIEGLGRVPAHVVRSFHDGLAVKFHVDEEEKESFGETLKRIQGLAETEGE